MAAAGFPRNAPEFAKNFMVSRIHLLMIFRVA
jgi:hypothetical protein